jgi:hypothetical protein
MKIIISASRRTDIPAFYTNWFINSLKQGFVDVKHPYAKKWQRISLKPEDIGAVVFWSKNYSPLLRRIQEIEKRVTNLFFHFTITGNEILEPNVPHYIEAIKDFIFISKRYSPKHIIWRFDPICITDELSFDYYQDKFVRCAERLQGYTDKCYISFVNLYKKVIINLKKYVNQKPLKINEITKRKFAYKLACIAEKYNIKLYSCCNDYLLSEKVGKASCINGHYLSHLFNIFVDTRSAPTRKECACTKSIDIGKYNTCFHGCIYCYANSLMKANI